MFVLRSSSSVYAPKFCLVHIQYRVVTPATRAPTKMPLTRAAAPFYVGIIRIARPGGPVFTQVQEDGVFVCLAINVFSSSVLKMNPSLLALFYLAVASASTVSRQIQLGDDEYFLPPTAAWKLESWDVDAKHTDEFTPLTVVNLNDTADAARVSLALKKYDEADDVWTASFAQVLYIQSEHKGNDKWLKDLASEYKTSQVYYSDNENSTAPGPYFVQSSTGDVYQAYRLYDDTNQAFIQSSYQDPSGTHHPLRAASFAAGGLTIAVPSRLYFTPTQDKPLAGVRISIKDLFDLEGLKTSGGSRALYEMSDIKTKTAVGVQKLIDAGAIVIGKNKLSQFAMAGPYAPENIDYLLPFNPRGDGYNSPSDSSCGSGAAVASYDWLDASMGSDTGGSIRAPASANGVHGNRPTQDAVDLTGALPLSSSMDTAGMLVRDPALWSKINRVLYAGTIKEHRSLPKLILLDPVTPDSLSDWMGKEATAAANNFLDALSKILSANATVFSIDDTWNKTAPAALNNTSINRVVSAIYGNLTGYEQYTEFGKEFVETYKESHDGDFPHMVPFIRSWWLDADRTMTKESHERDLEIKAGVADWVAENVLIPDEDSCSNAVYVYFSAPSMSYKMDVSAEYVYHPKCSASANTYSSINPFLADVLDNVDQQHLTILELNKTINCNTTLGSEKACDLSLQDIEDYNQVPVYTVFPGRLASVSGFPDHTITLESFDLGENTLSNSTLQNQSLPLSVNIMAAKGCDFTLLDIAEKLYEEGAIKKVRTGSIV
ncbi:hypothetical protein FZEAL_9834 [Fusarium zealandicum]|uniref:Amidase domain-containing protein n=1 Tax=Fusarium zealandicum TaxID=1053134 RepID=A0A8H4U848_9HYPO|nr:hypothetical protein FZEAL_9834 [Fusarium zealandicum]